MGIKEQIIPVNNRLFAIHRQVLARPQFKLTRRIRRKHSSLMQPERLVLDAQIPRRLVERRNWMWGVKDNFEHTKKLLFHKIEKTGREVPARLPTDLFRVGDRAKKLGIDRSRWYKFCLQQRYRSSLPH